MNVSRATRLWTLGAVVALSAAACNGADYRVGAALKDESVQGAGGSDNTGGSVYPTAPGVAGEDGSYNGTGGETAWLGGAISVTSGGDTLIDWGDLPIPENCSEVNTRHNSAECELEAECGGSLVSSRCFEVEDSFQCECPSTLAEFRLTGASIEEACSYALAVCSNWAELESGALECIPAEEVDEPDSCLWDGLCMFDGVVGDATFATAYVTQSDCSKDGSSWTCECGWLSVSTFKLATTTSDHPLCLDARAWCAGVGVEPIGTRTCSSTSDYQNGDSCYAELECQRAVTLSGQEATTYEDGWVDCYFASNGLYRCTCWDDVTYTEIAAGDLENACATAVSLCEGE